MSSHKPSTTSRGGGSSWGLARVPAKPRRSLIAAVVDPLGLAGRAAGTARLGLRAACWAEKQAFQLLRARLEAVDPAPPELTTGSRADSGEALDHKMRQLLARALDQSTSSGQAELFHRILDQLVPDEARILGALSDGSVSPLVDIRARTRTGGVGEPVLENASLVGRTANLALPRLTANYVTHLISLGLVETGPEDPELKTDYEILMAETHIISALKDASRPPFPARVDKQTLRLSSLGAALWSATEPGGS